VGRLADSRVIHAEVCADGADQDNASFDTDPHLHGYAV
jgi:hypothetical protein